MMLNVVGMEEMGRMDYNDHFASTQLIANDLFSYYYSKVTKSKLLKYYRY